MTRTKLRARAAEQAAQFINDAAGLVEREACRHCAVYELEGAIPGHAECWKYVRIAREIRKLGERGVTK